ncbi:MAG: LysR family transcriptional regulator [Betaproteobacteria bacterium]
MAANKPASSSPRASFRLRITRGDDIAVGPGKVDLLEAIDVTGSISAAARSLGMSYRRAWLLIDTMNRCFRQPVVDAEAGGPRGGGARLTPTGQRVALHYRSAQRLATRSARADTEAIRRLLAPAVAGRRGRG